MGALDYIETGKDNGGTLVIYLGFGAHAKDISGLSLYPGEKECMISPLQPTVFQENGEGKTTKGNNGKWTIDLSDVNKFKNEYKKLNGICFVTDPSYFSWNLNNSNVHKTLKSAVQRGESLTE